MTAAIPLATGVLEVKSAGPGGACAYCGQPCASDGPSVEGFCSAEHRLLLRIAGGTRMGCTPLQPPDAEEVRRLRRAMAEATGWEQLFHLAQRIWHCPVVDDVPYRTSARAQLHGAYTKAVERLWRTAATRGQRRGRRGYARRAT
jgi:hypothetical protein